MGERTERSEGDGSGRLLLFASTLRAGVLFTGRMSLASKRRLSWGAFHGFDSVGGSGEDDGDTGETIRSAAGLRMSPLSYSGVGSRATGEAWGAPATTDREGFRFGTSGKRGTVVSVSSLEAVEFATASLEFGAS